MTDRSQGWQSWILAALFTVSMGLGTCASNTLANRQEKVEVRVGDVEKQAALRGERLAALETQAKQNNEAHTEIKALLQQLVNMQMRAARK
jgi:hypothetical protein